MDHRHLYRLKWHSFMSLAWYLECSCGDGCYIDERRWRFVKSELELMFL